jgi:hypothetical protein
VGESLSVCVADPPLPAFFFQNLGGTVARQIRCRKCKAKFTPMRGSSRVNCFTCRPSRAKAVSTTGRSPAPGMVETATLAELGRAQRLETVAGALAVRLAKDLDSSELTGSQASSLSGQLLKVLAAAVAGAPVEPDTFDEFTARLRAKRASA